MMFEQVFSKAKAEELLETLRAGRPLSPGKDGWTIEDLVFVGGACLYFTWARSADNMGITRLQARALFGESTAFATAWYALMTTLVDNDIYDDKHEPECRAAVGTMNGQPQVTPISGYRPRKPVERSPRGAESPPKRDRK